MKKGIPFDNEPSALEKEFIEQYGEDLVKDLKSDYRRMVSVDGRGEKALEWAAKLLNGEKIKISAGSS